MPLQIPYMFYPGSGDPYDVVNWSLRDVSIRDANGRIIFEMRDCEAPEHMDDNAVSIIAQKYFKVPVGGGERETSFRQAVHRIVSWLADKGLESGYFDEENRDRFYNEYVAMHLLGVVSHNSPVWFNVGVEDEPQCHACFIQDTGDSIQEISEVAGSELRLFKYGSGTGSNRSKLRSSFEQVAGGGRANGPIPFIRYYNAGAAAIKSGGKTRRAAKMEILDVDHPDVYGGKSRYGQDFITVKAEEERLMRVLKDAGEDVSWNSRIMQDLFPFQNCNMSVRATDDFMRMAQFDGHMWPLRARLDNSNVAEFPASEILDAIARAAHYCGDPGMQFHDRVNMDNTVPNDEEIVASNPCSEYMFLNDTACNLASTNLRKFSTSRFVFDFQAFIHANWMAMVACDVLIDHASYPTEEIRCRSLEYRTIGIGYGNLGALLMEWGLPYDSEAARVVASAITSMMQAACVLASADLSDLFGRTEAFVRNEEAWLKVLNAMSERNLRYVNEAGLLQVCLSAWGIALKRAVESGQRNAQLTVLAPTGTIRFPLDLDTTGMEPEILLVSYKNLSGGGAIKIVNRVVPYALLNLGYSEEQIKDICKYVHANEVMEGAPHIREEHLPVFDTALRPARGTRSISTMGHVKMLAALQPFISGAISKTVNCPEETTVAQIKELYLEAWRMGLKCIAIYRDNSKVIQAVGSKSAVDDVKKSKPAGSVPQRLNPPRERASRTIKFRVGGHTGYMTVGFYDNGKPCEVFVEIGSAGSVVNGWAKSWSKAVSLMVQVGVPIEQLVSMFSTDRFEPNGLTDDKDIRIVPSIAAFVIRKFAVFFGVHNSNPSNAELLLDAADQSTSSSQPGTPEKVNTQDTVPCSECGHLAYRSGTCYTCANCGTTTGCSG